MKLVEKKRGQKTVGKTGKATAFATTTRQWIIISIPARLGIVAKIIRKSGQY